MKKYFFLILSILTLWSCKKNEMNNSQLLTQDTWYINKVEEYSNKTLTNSNDVHEISFKFNTDNTYSYTENYKSNPMLSPLCAKSSCFLNIILLSSCYHITINFVFYSGVALWHAAAFESPNIAIIREKSRLPRIRPVMLRYQCNGAALEDVIENRGIY